MKVSSSSTLAIKLFLLVFSNFIANSYSRHSSREGVVSNRQETESCVTLADRNGFCSYFDQCFSSEYNSNFSLVESHSCTIDETYVGLCCSEKREPVSGELFEEEALARILPVIAVEQSGTWNSETPEADESEKGDWTRSQLEDFDEIRRNSRQSRGCGTTGKSRTRLVGGRPADPAEWPWMAALLRQGAGQYCGGVLITDRHILTAAHCVYRYKPREIRVRLGEYDFTRTEETRTLDFSVTEIRVHRDFDYTSYENDIAIVKIHRPTIFNTFIWPVCLPPIHQSFENKSGIVTGWGTQYYGGPASTVLMEVSVPIWPQEKCVRSYTQRIPRTTMCAGAYEGGRDACQGDSGGPLLHQLANGRWVNVGVVSWGIRCGEPGHPGIYTRVNSYLDWIFANAVF